MSASRLTALLALALVATSCEEDRRAPRELGEAQAPRSPPSIEPPRAPAVPAGGFAGPEACAECHLEEAERLALSGHSRAVRSLGPGSPPLGSFENGAPRAASAAGLELDGTPPAFVLLDQLGAPTRVAPSHAMGSRRREDYLAPEGSQLRVLPFAWSVAREAWARPLAEELGGVPEPEAGQGWAASLPSHEVRCSRCHLLSPRLSGADVAMSPTGAERLPPGISCEHCHGPAAEHVREARAAAAEGRDPLEGGVLRSSPDAWSGCAHCHAVASRFSLTSEAPGPEEAFDSHFFAARLGTPLGTDVAFYLDGRPGTPHGYEVQALAQSACSRRGELSCLGCHDPHGSPWGASLRQRDPDSSCRSCHAEIAAAAQDHARHPVASAPVPLASEEPGGPHAERLPGCVDCHLAATLVFGPADRVRDHAIGSPEPELSERLGIPDACGSCHPGEPPARLVAWLDEAYPGRRPERLERAQAFASAELALRSPEGDAAAAAALLLPRLADAGLDPWTRASAADLLGALGSAAAAAAPALLDAAEDEDPVLAFAALSALARLGTDERDRLAELARGQDDWRLRLAAAAALDSIGDPRGAEEIELVRADDRLPLTARAHSTFELGMALLRRGAGRRAAYLLEEASRLAPDHVPAWLNLGVARAGLGDFEGARLAWRTVLELEPGHPHARENLRTLDEALPGAPGP